MLILILGKDSAKNLLNLYVYIRPVPVKDIQFSIHVRMNEYAHITATNNALRSPHVVAYATKALYTSTPAPVRFWVWNHSTPGKF